MRTTAFSVLAALLCCFVVRADVIVSGVGAYQMAGNESECAILYNLTDSHGLLSDIGVVVSTNGGVTYDVKAWTFSGACGIGISAGNSKEIRWNLTNDMPEGVYSMKVKVVANQTMRLIPPSTDFVMGNCMTNSDGESDELPLHSVYVSPYYIDQYEVSGALWRTVYEWATNNGYGFDNVGSYRRLDNPVHSISWNDAVKWCNARSQMEGLVPCYYMDSTLLDPYTNGFIVINNSCVAWQQANGYRLPTEAEWEKAAREGTPGHRFPWPDTDTIQHTRANYYSFGPATIVYDTGGTRGYHPTYSNALPNACTAPVNMFRQAATNSLYKLCNMAGNVSEMCWDVYDGSYYSSSPDTDPHGPAEAAGSYRVIRGGNWGGIFADYFMSRGDARYARSADRYNAGGANNQTGFRCVRALAAPIPSTGANRSEGASGVGPPPKRSAVPVFMKK